LFARKLDDLQAVALEGTEGAESPFFSPDAKWVAFASSGKLKKVPVAGGTPVTVAEAPTFRGGVWLSDDTIIFVPNRLEALKRVSSSGGAVTDFGTPLTGSATPRWPEVLPGEKTIIFTEQPDPVSSEGLRILAAPIAGGAPKVLVPDGYYARYVSSGHILYMVQGALFAAAFDPERLELVGPPTPVVESLAVAASAGSAQFSVSAGGALVYVPGNLGLAPTSLASWMTRDGKVTPMITRRIDWRNANFSPDGKRLALEVFDGKNTDIWIYDIAKDSLVQLTLGQGTGSHFNRLPVWTPDGRRIAFTSNRDRPDGLNLYWTNADGSGDIARLTDSPNRQWPFSWHPSGMFLAFHEEVAVSGPDPGRGLTIRGGRVVQEDLMILPMGGDEVHGLTPGKPTGFLQSPAREATPMFSPDGRWIAYSSDELGEYEIFVRPFPPRQGSPAPGFHGRRRDVPLVVDGGERSSIPAGEQDHVRALGH
jgi:serine/threonine-protein kinase